MADGVVLLHGIFRTKRSMQKLARHLEAAGFRTLNTGYPSTRAPIEALAQQLHAPIADFAETCDGKLHFIGYSMGGLIIRAYLNKTIPEKLGRVVMLGTPNQGSEIADWLHRRWMYRRLYGPAGQQLITQLENAGALFGTVHYELGIIAGNRSIDPISSRIIRRANDGKVSIESTKLEGMADHIVLPVTHTFFPANRQVWRLTEHFLKYGRFA